MYKGIRKYGKLIKRHRAMVSMVAIALVLLLFQVVPALAGWVQSVTVSGTPDFGNSPPIVTTIPSSGYMDDTGTHATLTGNLSDLSIFPDADVWFEWWNAGGQPIAEGLQTTSRLGNYTEDIEVFEPIGETFFRFVGENPDGRTYGDTMVLQVKESSMLGGYRLLATVVPITFVGLIVVGMVGALVKFLGIIGLFLGGFAVYIGMPLLTLITSSITGLLGG